MRKYQYFYRIGNNPIQSVFVKAKNAQRAKRVGIEKVLTKYPGCNPFLYSVNAYPQRAK